MQDRTISTFTDTGNPARITLDLSRVATDEAVITAEDWAAIPGLLGLPEVDAERWAKCGPHPGWEFVKQGGRWRHTEGQRLGMVLDTTAVICDLALPLLTARDTRLPEVG